MFLSTKGGCTLSSPSAAPTSWSPVSITTSEITPSARSETWVLKHPLLKGNFGIIYLVSSAQVSPELFANWSLLNWHELQEEGWRTGSRKTNPDQTTSACFLQLCSSKAFIDGYWPPYGSAGTIRWFPAPKSSFLPRLKKNYIIQFKLSQVMKQM